MMAQSESRTAPSESFLGQPRLLANLAGLELWERFSFFGMQGLLLIYLYYSTSRGGLGLSQTSAAAIVGTYGASVYLSTILGAWLADRLLGAERTLFYSAVTVMLGHVALALAPGIPGLALGLTLVALGSGGVKSNATSMIGALYAHDDPRRDAGFAIFYLGVNLGAFTGPILTGLAQLSWGFHAGFGLAALGMAVGLAQYAVRRRRLAEHVRAVPNPAHTRAKATRYLRYLAVGAVILAAATAALAGDLLTTDRLPLLMLGIAGSITIVYFTVMLRDSLITASERSRVLSMIPLFLCSAVFWSVHNQQFTVITIYSDKRLDRSFYGWEMPVSWVQSVNPIFNIVFAGVFAALWNLLGPRQPSTVVKFGLGTILMGLTYLLFLILPKGLGVVPLGSLAAVLLISTLAEMLVSPVSLSAASKLAPGRYRTQMVALNFMAIAIGTAIAGFAARFYDPLDETRFFLTVGSIPVMVGVVLLLAAPQVRRMMVDIR